MRYFLRVQYHGAAFSGWQRQPGAASVQQLLEESLEVLLKTPTEVMGAGRTDQGVHATGQMAHFDCSELPDEPAVFLRKLNGILPTEISAPALYAPLDERLHARFSATSRAYCYAIARYKNPLLADRALLLTEPLDVEAMQAAAQTLFQYQDFASFCKAGGNQHTTRCEIIRSEWQAPTDRLEYHVQASRFLRGMVRALVGTLLQVGRGELTVEGFKAVVERKDRTAAGANVAAKGLCLTQVTYFPGALRLLAGLGSSAHE